ncbi:MAG: rod shape-determining protein MreD [Anaerovorax sp.]
MKSPISFIIFFIGFILQSTIMMPLRIGGVSPNIILCLVIVFAFLFDNYQCFVFAILFGLLQDICFSQTIGVAAGSYFLVAMGVYALQGLVNKENRLSIICTTIGGTLVYSLLYGCISTVFGASYSALVILKVQPILIIYNIVVVMILYSIFARKVIRHKEDKNFKGKFISYE